GQPKVGTLGQYSVGLNTVTESVPCEANLPIAGAVKNLTTSRGVSGSCGFNICSRNSASKSSHL
ncbi:MAG: hypothetical protein WCK93_10630, partial [Nitrosomonadales bacterium]